ncbi:MAG TPA: protein-L-isoaspartate(D-aspartate) O-methyltransferase [Desulfohalobiaceae bacterium]|nr:protein-L-isoaspartate(D-aspartate) O-methyltransferase [Desulfohalobiaceae bacterium]
MKYDKDNNFQTERERMVRSQIENRGVTNPLVIKAMRTVPRHEFMPEDVQDMAYTDRPLPLGQGQTISQPYIVAFMTQSLRLCGGEKVLEIGTGLGYQAAVLSQIASEVYSIEYLAELEARARNLLTYLGYNNVHLKLGDGTLGWPEMSPFDGIIVTASGPDIPDSFKEQLAVGGRLVMPVGEYRFGQTIIRLTKGTGGHFQEERLLDVAFVPLQGKFGWNI